MVVPFRISTLVIAILVSASACQTGGGRLSRAPAPQWHAKIYVGGPETGSDFYVANATTSRLTAMRVRSTVTVRGVFPQGEFPWYLHVGRCEEGSAGPIIGNPDDYQPLLPGPDGVHTATANLRIRLDDTKDHFVTVHRSADAMTTILACGQLQRG